MRSATVLTLALLVSGGDESWAQSNAISPRLGVRCVAFSPDGKQLAAGTGLAKEAGRLILWELPTGTARILRQEDAGVPAVAWSPDGTTLAMGLSDGSVRLLDASSGEIRLNFAKIGNEVRAISFLPDGASLATGNGDGTLRLWDAKTARQQRLIQIGEQRVLAVPVSPDGSEILSAGFEESAAVWSLATGASRRMLLHGGRVVRDGCFTPDGRWIITTGFDGTTRVWNRQTGALRCKLRAGGDLLAYAPGTLAICGIPRGSIHLFNITLDEPAEEISRQITKLIALLDDDDYAVREVTTEKLLSMGLPAEPQLYLSMSEHPSVEVRIRCRRIRARLLRQPTASLVTRLSRIECLDISPDGKQLASGARDGTIELWDVPSRKLLTALAQ